MKFESTDPMGNVCYFKDKDRTILHNEDGPAILKANGEKEFYLDGKWVTEGWFNKMKEPLRADGGIYFKLDLWRASNYLETFYD